MVRAMLAGPRAIGATEPLAGRATERPTDVTPTGASLSLGPKTSTSWPSRRNAPASPRTWPCTPPGTLSEYALTTATRTVRSVSE